MDSVISVSRFLDLLSENVRLAAHLNEERERRMNAETLASQRLRDNEELRYELRELSLRVLFPNKPYLNKNNLLESINDRDKSIAA